MKRETMLLNLHFTGGNGPLEQVLEERGLYPVFQPILKLGQAGIYAHEALIRGPRGTRPMRCSVQQRKSTCSLNWNTLRCWPSCSAGASSGRRAACLSI